MSLSPREELDNLFILVNSEEWKQFLRIKQSHAEYLQAEVNRCVAKGEYRSADRAQAKLEENERDIQLLNKRMDELRKLMPPEEGFTHD